MHIEDGRWAKRAGNDLGVGTPRYGRSVELDGGRVARGGAAPGLVAPGMAGGAGTNQRATRASCQPTLSRSGRCAGVVLAEDCRAEGQSIVTGDQAALTL